MKRVFSWCFCGLFLSAFLAFAGEGSAQAEGYAIKTSFGEDLTITKNDVAVEEGSAGATWSADSRKVYFVRYSYLSTSKKISEAAGADLKVKMAKMEAAVKADPSLQNNPAKLFTDYLGPEGFANLFKASNTVPLTLYERLEIYAYDVESRAVTALATIDGHPFGYPFLAFFEPMLVDNKIKMEYNGQIYLIDAVTGEFTKKEARAGDGVNLSRDKIVLGEKRGTMRYLSPDRHSFAEFTQGYPDVGMFHDPQVYLNTIEEMSSTGGIPSPDVVARVMKNRPDTVLGCEQLCASEEKTIRAKLGML